jgi:hypothetical protein
MRKYILKTSIKMPIIGFNNQNAFSRSRKKYFVIKWVWNYVVSYINFYNHPLENHDLDIITFTINVRRKKNTNNKRINSIVNKYRSIVVRTSIKKREYIDLIWCTKFLNKIFFFLSILHE